MQFPRSLAVKAVLTALSTSVLVGCSPMTVLNALSRTEGTSRLAVPYGQASRQQLDIYFPADAPPAGGWPVAVFFYGGSWNTGERADYAFVGRAMAMRGVLTMVADYRLYPAVRYPEFLQDSAKALAWGMAHARELGGNPRRIFVMGHSAGAYNAAMLALDSRWLAAEKRTLTELAGWIGLAGPYDFFPTDNAAVRPVFFHPNYPPHAQPIEFGAQGGPPSFLGAPLEDSVVDPVRSTQALAMRLRQAGVPVVVKRYERVGHAALIGTFASPLRWLAPVLDDVSAFIADVPEAPVP